MNTAALLTILTHPELFKKPPTVDDRLAYLRDIEADESTLASLIALRHASQSQSTSTESARERRERQETESEAIVALERLAQMRDEYLSNLQKQREDNAIFAAVIPWQQVRRPQIDKGEVTAVIEGLSGALSAILISEGSLLSQVAAFDVLRKWIETPSGDPDNFTDAHFQLIAGRKLRVEAMIRHLPSVADAVCNDTVRLVPLVQAARSCRDELVTLLRRGRAELLARARKTVCLMEDRHEAFTSTPPEEFSRPSEGAARFVARIGHSTATFDDLKKAAAVFVGELASLLNQLAETTAALGREIPNSAEFFGNLCPCGCGQENAGVRFSRAGVSVAFLAA